MIFTQISLFMKSAKGLFYVGFAVLFASILLLAYCKAKPEPPPVVTVIESTPIEPAVLPAVITHVDEAVIEVKKEEVQAVKKVETAKVILKKKVETIQKTPSIAPEERDKQVGTAQIESLHSLFNEYYPSTSGGSS